MTNTEIAKLIQAQYKYIKQPQEMEVLEILKAIKIRMQSSRSISELELDSIINDKLANRTRIVNDSVDMSASQSILQQILQAAKGV